MKHGSQPTRDLVERDIQAQSQPMIDPVGRKVDYLRVSVTDRCNERCLYCMPEQFQQWIPRKEVLTDDELLAVIDTAAELGFRKFRITGGEPMVRPKFPELVQRILQIPGVESLSMTTNGTRLRSLAQPLWDAGLRKFNMSLDAIDPDIYQTVTGGRLADVIAGLEAAQAAGFQQIKLNTVLMRGKNDDQILPLLDFAAERKLTLRFIELMPVSLTEVLDESNFLPLAEVRDMLEQDDEISLCEHQEAFGFGPARYYHLKRRGIKVGFIGAMTDLNFCEQCNKMRLTCDGMLRPCLGNHMETDLKQALRPEFDLAQLKGLFLKGLGEKPEAHLFRENYQPQRIMTAIGG
ncbi:MAG: GTP 3',8-cyclase MoaA [Verrucomicrobiota bacterium]